MKPHIYIIVVNYNGLSDVQRCLRSIVAIDYPSLSTVLVDNASQQDPEPSVRHEFPWCQVVRNPSNRGWAGGNNTGICFALGHRADQIVLLNSDTIVSPLLAERLAEAAEIHRGFGIIGPVINFMDEPDRVMTDGCLFNHPAQAGFFQRKPIPNGAKGQPGLTKVDIVNGCCMMVSAGVFRRIGLIDERFFLVHEETDFCLRARQAGILCGVIGETLVWHKGSSSFGQTGKPWQRYYDARNLYLLLKKHLPTHQRGRSPWRSRLEYLKYIYYRYAIERENGRNDAADAVLEGFHDAMLGRYGILERNPRPTLPVLRKLFEWWRLRRLGRLPNGDSVTHASAIR